MENLLILGIFLKPVVWLPAVIFAIIVFFISIEFLRRERTRMIVSPGLGRSSWITVGGDEKDFYYDVDKGTSTLEGMHEVSKWYVDNIKELQENNKIDYLAFIEREDGPVGAITKKDLISFLSNLPSIIVRPKRRIFYSAIKGEKDISKKNVVVISDVATTGYSIKAANNLIAKRGAKVVAAITIMNRGGKDTIKTFKDAGIKFIFASNNH